MTDNPIIEKIKKLMEMTVANGCTEDEARNAARKVARLLLKHRLNEADIKISMDHDEYKSRVTHGRTPFRKAHRGAWKWQVDFACAVAYAMGCKALFGKPQYGSTGFITFVGNPVDIEAATYMFGVLVDEFVKIATIARAQAYKDMMEAEGHYTIGKNWFRDFMTAIAMRVANRIRDDFKQMVEEENASSTMLAIYDENQAYINNKWGKTGTLKVDRPGYTNMEAARRGFKAGDKVGIPNPKAKMIKG